MRSKLLTDAPDQEFVLVFEPGEEVAAGLLDFARAHDITAAHFTAIGAFQDVTLGWFNLETNEYERVAIDEQVEVLNVTGNIAVHDGNPKVHAHVVVGKRDGTAHGGHLLEAHVRPTLEVMLTETPQHLQRQIDSATGLALIDVSETQPPRRGRSIASETT